MLLSWKKTRKSFFHTKPVRLLWRTQVEWVRRSTLPPACAPVNGCYHLDPRMKDSIDQPELQRQCRRPGLLVGRSAASAYPRTCIKSLLTCSNTCHQHLWVLQKPTCQTGTHLQKKKKKCVFQGLQHITIFKISSRDCKMNWASVTHTHTPHMDPHLCAPIIPSVNTMKSMFGCLQRHTSQCKIVTWILKKQIIFP